MKRAALTACVLLASALPLRAQPPNIDERVISASVVDNKGAVIASAPLPVPDRPMVERWAAALNAVAQGRTIEVVAENGHVEALAQLLDAAAGGAAVLAVPAPKGAVLTGNEIAAFSDVTLKAKLDAP